MLILFSGDHRAGRCQFLPARAFQNSVRHRKFALELDSEVGGALELRSEGKGRGARAMLTLKPAIGLTDHRGLAA